MLKNLWSVATLSFAVSLVTFAGSIAVWNSSVFAQGVHEFNHRSVARDAVRYENFLKKNWQPGERSARQWRISGSRALGAQNDPRAASRNFAKAVVANTQDARAWLGLGKALLAIKPKSNEKYSLPTNGTASAYMAYRRAASKALKGEALAVLAQGLKRRSYWRSAINALKLSQKLAPSAITLKAYTDLRAQKGFRITDYKIDSDARLPRLCVQFSERLARGDIDFAPFVSVDGKDPQNVTAEPRQMCIDGLKHGKRYEIQLRAGLPSAIGENLLKSAPFSVYVRDRSPTVRFSGRGYVLPNKGQQGIPLVTVNTDQVEVEVFRLGDRSLVQTVQGEEFQRQLDRWQFDKITKTKGARVYKGVLAVARKLNDDVTTAFPVSEALPQLKPGVYALRAKPLSGKDRSSATQWFIVSDLGMSALSGETGLHAFIRSLDSAAPLGNVTVRLLARNNEELGRATTDQNGYAKFAPGLTRGEGGLAPAVLVAQTKRGDYAFLDLDTAAFDLTDRGVKGREAPGPLDAFVYTERGVYRPGETVHISALLRDAKARAARLPVTLIVTRPDGVEHRRFVLKDAGQGGRYKSLVLGRSVMTGTWRAKLHADPKGNALAQVKFLVEDFVPERLELKLTAASKAISVYDGGVINIAGRYLYGPAAADLALEGDVIVRASKKSVAGFKGYRFGLANKSIAPSRGTLGTLPRTDKDGNAALKIKLPKVEKTAKSLEALIRLRLREPGGRTIERSMVLPVDLRQPRLGIKPLFKGGHISENETATFKVVMLDKTGKATSAKGLKWELSKLERHWQWYRQGGRWNYDAATTTRRIATGTVDADAARPAMISARIDSGRYRLEVTGGAEDGVVTTVEFNAGWWSDEGDDSPEILEVALDKKSYLPGETAMLKIAAKQAGKALIAVLNAGVVTTKFVDVPKGGLSVPLSVSDEWAPGVYVAAMLYRPMDRKARRMPGRSIGVQWLGLDAGARTLNVALDVPKKVKSGSTLLVPIKLAGLAPGSEAYVTVAAVDVGILSLTRFKSPAPQKWFYAQRRMGAEIRDFYGRLIDGMRAQRGALRSGGDGPSGPSMQGAPPTQKPLSLFSGIVKVGADGTSQVSFNLPDFNGTVRLMAVAWSGDKVGSVTKDVIVRDAVALLASGPRFLTLGDEARLEVDLHNVEGPAAIYKLSIVRETEDGAKQSVLNRDITLKVGQRSFERFMIKAGAIGPVKYALRVTGPGGIDVKRAMDFEVFPPAGDIKRTIVSALKPGGTLQLSADIFAGLIPGRSRMTVNVGPTARLDVPGILNALDRYPYGCAEQTVSRALPLLYVNALARDIGIANDGQVKKRVQAAINRVFDMQDSSGAFGIWGPSNADLWLTSYVTDFLTRAREAGYSVRKRPLRQALDRLQNFVSYASDFESGGERRAYALYVLARNGRAPIGELRYYADTRLERFSTPLAKAQIGAALAMMGDKIRATRAFAAAIRDLNKTADDLTRTDYGSTLRDGAAVLTLVSETGIAVSQSATLVDVVAKAYEGKSRSSTQEQAWTLLAARALSQKAKSTLLSVSGKAHHGAYRRGLSAKELNAASIAITNNGPTSVDAVLSVMGASLTPEPAISKSLTVTRRYYTMAGKQVMLDGEGASLKQNERLVVVLEIGADNDVGRLLLEDRLPAGLEIENPRLVGSGDLSGLKWLQPKIRPRMTQFRDDRFVAAFDFYKDANNNKLKTTVAYLVRAVTPGRFVHPAATIEDMYRPERYARTSSGHLTIKAVH